MEIKTRLVRGRSSELDVVSIVGMPGIGKTTLANEVYKDSYIMYHFDISAWTTISQSYNMLQILMDLLDSMKKPTKEMQINRENTEKLEEHTEKFKKHLFQSLKGRTYLIVMDDLWDTTVWDDLKRLFPNDKNSSRIMLTTRLQNVAVYANSSPPVHHMHFLNEEASWSLFCDKVFGENHCPPELEEIGKRIAQNCRGLPLTLVVIGGLLSKAPKTQLYWIDVAENLSSVTSSNDEQCSKILSLSYTHMPHHLKECFLYTGIFPEDYNIPVSKLVKLWIAEGFLIPEESESLEDVAYGYLMDLVGRSLISVFEWNSLCKIRICKIHDLVRDFCTREAKKLMLFHITDKSLYGIPGGTSLHRLSIHPNTTNIFPSDDKRLSSLQLSSFLSFDSDCPHSVGHVDTRSLRVWDTRKILDVQFQSHGEPYYNLHYLACGYVFECFHIAFILPNLQTLILRARGSFPQSHKVEIWNMQKLRHVQVETLFLSDPFERNPLVLENLQTLSLVRNFRCFKEILERIPNLKKLGITYYPNPHDWQYYCLNNLVYLDKLEVLKCLLRSPSPAFLHNLTFPHSLRKLTLERCGLPWEDMVIVASMPNLEVLKLKYFAFIGEEWEPAEGEFPNLKFLLLQALNLKHWRANSINFPRLQRLVIKRCLHLQEIPCDIGEILTLQLIELHNCANSLVVSAKEIQKEQLDLGNDGIQVRIQL